jgi:hypothetical protein
MKPRIDRTRFGSITVEGSVYQHDVIIRPDGRVKKRKKTLSQAVYGTSHTISLQEAKYVYEQGAGADRLIVGSAPVYAKTDAALGCRAARPPDVPQRPSS